MTAPYNHDECDKLVRWARSFASDPGTATDQRVILLREAIRDVLNPPLLALADQLEAARAEVERMSLEGEGILSRTRALLAERDAYRAMLRDLLASAHPHPTEHPTMTKQWERARELLKNGPRQP